MKLGNIKRISREEIPDAPDWLDGLLTPLNQSIEQLTQAVSGQLSYSDNIFCSVQTNTFTHGVELVTKNPLPPGVKPFGIHPFVTDNVVGIDGYRLVYKASGEAGITIFFKIPYSDIFLTRGAAQAINNTTDTAVIWTASTRLSGAFSWTSGTNPSRISVIAAGSYLFNFTASFAPNAVGGRAVWLSKNGVIVGTATRFGMTHSVNNGAGENWTASGSALVEMAVNDYVEVWVWQSSGGALNLLANAAEEVQLSGHSFDGKNAYTSPVTYVLVGG